MTYFHLSAFGGCKLALWPAKRRPLTKVKVLGSVQIRLRTPFHRALCQQRQCWFQIRLPKDWKTSSHWWVSVAKSRPRMFFIVNFKTGIGHWQAFTAPSKSEFLQLSNFIEIDNVAAIWLTSLILSLGFLSHLLKNTQSSLLMKNLPSKLIL